MLKRIEGVPPGILAGVPETRVCEVNYTDSVSWAEYRLLTLRDIPKMRSLADTKCRFLAAALNHDPIP